MDDAKKVWQWGQRSWNAFRPGFTRPGRERFLQWGTGPFHEPAGRSPNRTSTVRAPNWVEAGDRIARHTVDRSAACLAAS